jgi:hypothetical protein
MAETPSGTRPSITCLILVPSLITLAVTVLRLVGELQDWSKAWFNPEAGGPWSIVDITWLAPIFGIYFAVRLACGGEGPQSTWRALVFPVLGVAVGVAGIYEFIALQLHVSFEGRLIYFWTLFVLAALVTLPGWPALFRTLLAYGFAARIPVAIVMFLAFRGNWGTHYDALPPNFATTGLWSKFLWLGFFPQLTYWVGFTIVVGMLFGAIAASLMRLRRRPPQPVS